MNVLLYVKFLIDPAKIKTLVYFSTMFTHSFDDLIFAANGNFCLVNEGQKVYIAKNIH